MHLVHSIMSWLALGLLYVIAIYAGSQTWFSLYQRPPSGSVDVELLRNSIAMTMLIVLTLCIAAIGVLHAMMTRKQGNT